MTQFLQRSSWGKVGNRPDVFKGIVWIDMNGEELRRETKFQEFSLNR